MVVAEQIITANAAIVVATTGLPKQASAMANRVKVRMGEYMVTSSMFRFVGKSIRGISSGGELHVRQERRCKAFATDGIKQSTLDKGNRRNRVTIRGLLGRGGSPLLHPHL